MRGKRPLSPRSCSAAHGRPADGARSGFSLVEALITTLIIAFAATGLLSFFAYGTAFIEKQGLRRQALARVNEKLEWIRARQLADKRLAPGVETEDIAIERQAMGQPVRVEAKRTTTVSRSADQDGQRVRVMVTYAHGDIVDSISLETAFYR
jgi:Tfp pilus assembly protein PilV